ncbi:MAG: hypothetical protein SFV17_07295 [Candidatus Obscuribacter sp.]|nr:hypothetical protein [Candidatus Melainabacteria bacterium]MDX1986475.1 hypothetical protein [Candidatus Obscuribacter sp.]
MNTSTTQKMGQFTGYSPKFAGDPKGCLFTVMNPNEPLPPAFKLKAADAGHQVIVRIAGGCTGISPEAQDGMIPFFVNGFTGFAGVAFSGGTANRDSAGNLKADMVTNIPSVLSHYYNCISLSTTPRTDDLYADRERAGIAIGSQALDIRQHALAIVQVSAAQKASAWDLDVPVYFQFMQDLMEQGWGTALIALNGGEITRDEIYGALKRGIPVIAVEGSLRETDAFIKAYRDGDWTYTCSEYRAKQLAKGLPQADIEARITSVIADCQAVLSNLPPSLVSIVKLNDAKALETTLKERGLLR